jgi:hypothetical protein
MPQHQLPPSSTPAAFARFAPDALLLGSLPEPDALVVAGIIAAPENPTGENTQDEASAPLSSVGGLCEFIQERPDP